MRPYRHILCLALALGGLLLSLPGSAEKPLESYEHPQRDWAVRVQGHAAIFSAKSERTADPSFGWGLEGSLRFRSLGLIVEVGQHLWPTLEWELSIRPGLFFAALGGEFLYAGGRLRSCLAVGAATLIYDTGFGDGPGRTGPFVHLVPMAIRVPLGSHVIAELRPLSWIWALPVLKNDRHLLRNDIVFSIALEVGS